MLDLLPPAADLIATALPKVTPEQPPGTEGFTKLLNWIAWEPSSVVSLDSSSPPASSHSRHSPVVRRQASRDWSFRSSFASSSPLPV